MFRKCFLSALLIMCIPYFSPANAKTAFFVSEASGSYDFWVTFDVNEPLIYLRSQMAPACYKFCNRQSLYYCVDTCSDDTVSETMFKPFFFAVPREIPDLRAEYEFKGRYFKVIAKEAHVTSDGKETLVWIAKNHKPREIVNNFSQVALFSYPNGWISFSYIKERFKQEEKECLDNSDEIEIDGRCFEVTGTSIAVGDRLFCENCGQ